jgi:hypothetical protein
MLGVQQKNSSNDESSAIDVKNENSEEDREFNNLMDWCTALDFENYCNEWKEIGTTAMSEASTSKYRNMAKLI